MADNGTPIVNADTNFEIPGRFWWLRVRRVVRLRDQPVILFVTVSHPSEQLLAFSYARLPDAVKFDRWPQGFKDESEPLEQAHERGRHCRADCLHTVSRRQQADTPQKPEAHMGHKPAQFIC